MTEETAPAAADEETEEPPEADLSALRWSVKDALPDGITFHGRMTSEGWVVEARRLAQVPIRFSLAEPRRFAGLAALVTGVLQEGTYFLGEERRPLEGEGPEIPQGDHPLFASPDPAASPVAHFRKTSRDTFEIEVPWKTGFSAWAATRPIL